MSDPITRFCEQQEKNDPHFDRLIFFRRHYGNDVEGDKWYNLWRNNQATPISLRDHCEAVMNQRVLDFLQDRRQTEMTL